MGQVGEINFSVICHNITCTVYYVCAVISIPYPLGTTTILTTLQLSPPKKKSHKIGTFVNDNTIYAPGWFTVSEQPSFTRRHYQVPIPTIEIPSLGTPWTAEKRVYSRGQKPYRSRPPWWSSWPNVRVCCSLYTCMSQSPRLFALTARTVLPAVNRSFASGPPVTLCRLFNRCVHRKPEIGVRYSNAYTCNMLSRKDKIGQISWMPVDN